MDGAPPGAVGLRGRPCGGPTGVVPPRGPGHSSALAAHLLLLPPPLDGGLHGPQRGVQGGRAVGPPWGPAPQRGRGAWGAPQSTRRLLPTSAAALRQRRPPQVRLGRLRVRGRGSGPCPAGPPRLSRRSAGAPGGEGCTSVMTFRMRRRDCTWSSRPSAVRGPPRRPDSCDRQSPQQGADAPAPQPPLPGRTSLWTSALREEMVLPFFRFCSVSVCTSSVCSESLPRGRGGAGGVSAEQEPRAWRGPAGARLFPGAAGPRAPATSASVPGLIRSLLLL